MKLPARNDLDQRFAIITAGGSGTRFGTPEPKQFQNLNGYPVFFHSAFQFRKFDSDLHIFITLPSDYISFWEERIKTKFPYNLSLIPGGASRFHSIQNAVKHLPLSGYVAIHDAVRPLVSSQLIAKCFDEATHFGNAIPAIKPNDSFRILDDKNLSQPMNRENLRAIQTPQVFRCADIKKAYELEFDASVTDDAMAIEKLGLQIHITEGEKNNFKITFPSDLAIASYLLNNQKTEY